jgi:C4-dicarboxylate-specific signal transduction histidine kinase
LVEGAFRNNNIQLLTEINSNKMVNGYENEFSQVLLNLLNNAKEIHIDRKTANAWVKVMVTEESGKHHVYVKDNGGGIVPGVEEKIFEPYFTTREMGTGLGLYMAKTIVENSMGGKLTAYNDQQGAIFEIML